MRDLFPGYFTPTDEEFKVLWTEATFAFDANVLLGLYKLTPETQQVFFDVLQRLADRIFLPNRAAYEYLRNRLSAISARSASHEAVKADAAKFVQGLEARMQEHPLPKQGQDLIEAAKQASTRISEIVDAGIEREPDLVRSDHVLSKLTTLFEGKTGHHPDPARFEELCKAAAGRYAKKIPPGYKDESKGEPDKYGDCIIWFELLEFAKAKNTSVVFITRDMKEDWWQQHSGETIGPRPELTQEMKLIANARFYMYTTVRFLEFAQKFFGLKPEPTKKATSEIEEVEKQEKQATQANQWVNYIPQTAWVNAEPTEYVATFDDTVGYFDNSRVARFPTFKVSSLEEDRAKQEHEKLKNEYSLLLPINGQVFTSSTGKWLCETMSTPDLKGNDRVCYQLKFQPVDRTRNSRSLALWVSKVGLKSDADWGYKKAIVRIITEWLDSGNSVAEITYLT